MKAPFVLVAILAAVGARADITSTFDTDSEGWQAANVSTSTFLPIEPNRPTTWNAGHIEASESMFTQSGAFILLAPQKYNGDLSGYLGGTVSYRLSDDTHDVGIVQPNLLLVGTDVATGNLLAIGYATTAPDPSGTNYTIPLSASGWITSSLQPVTATQFSSVLSHLVGFGIGADWTSNATDFVTLDNVRVAAVPEPATFAAVGLGMLAFVRRRGRSTPIS